MLSFRYKWEMRAYRSAKRFTIVKNLRAYVNALIALFTHAERVRESIACDARTVLYIIYY